MLYWLLHGHPLIALRQNPLAMITLPAVLYGLVRQWLCPESSVFTAIHPRWIATFAAVVIAFAIARNLPVEPFSLLAPCGNDPTLSADRQ